MFIPSSEVVIAINDTKVTTEIFKEFSSNNPNDKFEIKQMDVKNRSIDIIHSCKLYELMHEYLTSKYEEYQVSNLRSLINPNGRVKLYYCAPKELLKMMSASNISMTLYNKSYCLMFMTTSNDIIILLQAIKPITAIDEPLFNIILDHIAKGCIRYVIGSKEYNKQANDLFNQYQTITNLWYYEFIKTIIDRYNMIQTKTNEEEDEKKRLIEVSTNELISIVKMCDEEREIRRQDLIDFFKYKLPIKTNILKEETKEVPSVNMIPVTTIGIDNNKEMLLKYASEIIKPIDNIFTNNIYQPDVLLANDEYAVIVESAKQAYTKALGNIIDPMHIFKNTVLQELYHYYAVAVNYSTFKDDTKKIIELLAIGDVFSFQE